MIDCMYECVCDCMFDDVFKNIPLEICILNGEHDGNDGKCDNMKTEKEKKRKKNADVLRIPMFNINYKELKGRPSIEFRIKNKSVQCLLDTGARVNVIKAEIIKDMKDIKIKETKRRIHCANDSELINYGIVQLKVIIERLEKTIDFFVVKDLDPEMIAGIDFLDKFGIKLKKEPSHTENVLVIRDSPSDEDRLKRIKELYEKKLTTN